MIAIEGARPGEVIGGKFRVERVVGSGGMGVVVAAMHLQLDERVAIKLLYPQLAHDPATAARFTREARAAFKIKGEHVVRVMDVGQLESGAPYLVMEYLEGRDLASIVADHPLSVEDAATYVLQACEAIASAHALGFVHRDLKPANLFLTRREDGSPSVKVLDFGISKLPTTALTTTSAALGTPIYMSPEQMSSPRGVDARTDIYSLGVVLYELVAGRVPFNAETLPALSILVSEGRYVPLRKVAPHVSTDFQAVVARCLARRPDDRYATIAELAQALIPFAPDAAEHARRAAAALRATPAQPAVSMTRAVGLSDMELQATVALAGRAAREASSGPGDDDTDVDSALTPHDGDALGAHASGRRSRAVWLGAGACAVVVAGAVIVSSLRDRAIPASSPPTDAASIIVSAPLPDVAPAGALSAEPAVDLAAPAAPSASASSDAAARATAKPHVHPPPPPPTAAPPAPPLAPAANDNPLKRRK